MATLFQVITSLAPANKRRIAIWVHNKADGSPIPLYAGNLELPAAETETFLRALQNGGRVDHNVTVTVVES